MKPLAILAALTLPLAASWAQGPQPGRILIRGAHVFDGTGTAAQVRDVLIAGDRIVEVADRIAPPPGAQTIDGSGKTLLPGLHDLHTHMRSSGFGGPDDAGKAYAGYLAAGVTTAADFSVYHEMLAPIREMTRSGQVTAGNLKLAIRLSTTGGHGAEYGWGDDFTLQVDTPRAARLAMAKALPYKPDVIKVFTDGWRYGHGAEYGWGDDFTLQVDTPRAARLAMAKALPYKPDVIKVFTDGWRYGRGGDLTNMDVPTLSAIVEMAHGAGIPVITHTVTLKGAKIAAQAGVDALGHGIGDALVDAEVIRLMKASGTAYVPTLAVYEPQQTRRFTPRAMAALRPPEAAAEAEADRSDPITAIEQRRWDIMRANVKALSAAGVPIGVGTDAGIGGVYHGSGTLHEIRLLTEAGMTPAQALAAATGASAAILSDTPDHGRIAPGQRADLLLVEGRPDRRIDDLFAVREILLAGRRVDRSALARLLSSTAMTPLPVHRMTGPIDMGRGADGRTDLGTLLVNNSDAGVDHSDLEFARTPEPQRPIFMVARFGAAPQPFARLAVPLTRGGVHLADASGFAGIAFRVRGAGRYRAIVDQYGARGFSTEFEAGAQEREIRLPFTAFASRDGERGLDPSALRELEFELTGTPGGKQWLQLSGLRFYR